MWKGRARKTLLYPFTASFYTAGKRRLQHLISEITVFSQRKKQKGKSEE